MIYNLSYKSEKIEFKSSENFHSNNASNNASNFHSNNDGSKLEKGACQNQDIQIFLRSLNQCAKIKAFQNDRRIMYKRTMPLLQHALFSVRFGCKATVLSFLQLVSQHRCSKFSIIPASPLCCQLLCARTDPINQANGSALAVPLGPSLRSNVPIENSRFALLLLFLLMFCFFFSLTYISSSPSVG